MARKSSRLITTACSTLRSHRYVTTQSSQREVCCITQESQSMVTESEFVMPTTLRRGYDIERWSVLAIRLAREPGKQFDARIGIVAGVNHEVGVGMEFLEPRTKGDPQGHAAATAAIIGSPNADESGIA